MAETIIVWHPTLTVRQSNKAGAVFKVKGRGLFPFDMLRYDAAWPAGVFDAALIADTQERREVTLCTRGRSIHAARWESFGWRVTSMDGVPVDRRYDNADA